MLTNNTNIAKDAKYMSEANYTHRTINMNGLSLCVKLHLCFWCVFDKCLFPHAVIVSLFSSIELKYFIQNSSHIKWMHTYIYLYVILLWFKIQLWPCGAFPHRAVFWTDQSWGLTCCGLRPLSRYNAVRWNYNCPCSNPSGTRCTIYRCAESWWAVQTASPLAQITSICPESLRLQQQLLTHMCSSFTFTLTFCAAYISQLSVCLPVRWYALLAFLLLFLYVCLSVGFLLFIYGSALTSES